MAIKKDTIEALRAKMKDAPEVLNEARNVSKQEAIRELKNEIVGMQKRGYSIEDIAKFLSDGGLQISTPTLKSYLQRTKAKKKAPIFADAKTPQPPEKTISPSDKHAGQKQSVKTRPTENEGGFEVKPDSDI